MVEFHDTVGESTLGEDSDGAWELLSYRCANPNCKKLIFYLVGFQMIKEINGARVHTVKNKVIYKDMIRPKGSVRQPVPTNVPKEIAKDFVEACLVLHDSPTASAALSRRCLQHILREKAGIKKGDLANEIQQVLDSHQLPSHIAESIDAVRNIGNFAAHPNKSTSTGEIVSVESGEAEWNLDVIEMLLDYYFVEIEAIRAKKAALNKKLKDAGKPEMK